MDIFCAMKRPPITASPVHRACPISPPMITPSTSCTATMEQNTARLSTPQESLSVNVTGESVCQHHRRVCLSTSQESVNVTAESACQRHTTVCLSMSQESVCQRHRRVRLSMSQESLSTPQESLSTSEESPSVNVTGVCLST